VQARDDGREAHDAPVRVVTATSLFDGHDAAINLVRRLLQAEGAEVVHLGHNRSVDEVVTAVVQEDAHAVAVSSYQGGHMEYFTYLLERLRAVGRPEVLVYGGGGGVIVPSEIAELERRGVAKIFSPEDGQQLGLRGMAERIVSECRSLGPLPLAEDPLPLGPGDARGLARLLTGIVEGRVPPGVLEALRQAARARRVPVLGVTGTGGSGKSSLVDELVRRFRIDQEDKLSIAVVAIDPSRRRGGGALLGDRLRMNAIDHERIFFRSLSTRGAGAVPRGLPDVVAACRAAGFDLVVVETPGIGQGDSDIVGYVDLALYVMTPEFGGPSQLEKIDMLDFADAVALNKFERPGAFDALREVRRQYARLREAFAVDPEELPVFGTIASRFNDDGVTALYHYLRDRLVGLGLAVASGGGRLAPVAGRVSSRRSPIVPAGRSRYLAEIAETVRSYHARAAREAALARRLQQLREVAASLDDPALSGRLEELARATEASLAPETRELLASWPGLVEEYAGEEQVVEVGGRSVRTALATRTLSGTRVPKVALPRFVDHGELVRWRMEENVPGQFPYTAGVFPFKREDEAPTRMFAGEGDPFRTNRRFHLLAEGAGVARLSTAFDSVTLYGFDPDERPDIYGKVGNAGVSVATLDDMKVLFDGFDLCDPRTSVSMTINGPAPAILAMFFCTAIDQALERFEAEHGRPPSPAEAEEVSADVLRRVRGTVQADILKEDQGQNTCIFSTEFALRMMADVQEWFIEHEVRNFYSVSISGYHIAEAGANPITQLAFTLANAFTYVEHYLARGMAVDDFAPNLSFFFSNGMDAEYSVIGRVARRIWAVAMRDRYGANERSQRLKYHIQTSGRSLHAQEMAFNDIRTTLQALTAVYDNCNSLHTNAYDEAVTTPTEESVRRALAIQLIIGQEWGLARNENPLQGSFVVEELTGLVEEAVLEEFDRLAERGGVLGAMETGYQRGKIQDESMRYERAKHDGSLPVVGVNTFRNPNGDVVVEPKELARSTEEEKRRQLDRLAAFHRLHAAERERELERLRRTALEGGNLFDALMSAVRSLSLGEITEALFEVGGRYRRSM